MSDEPLTEAVERVRLTDAEIKALLVPWKHDDGEGLIEAVERIVRAHAEADRAARVEADRQWHALMTTLNTTRYLLQTAEDERDVERARVARVEDALREAADAILVDCSHFDAYRGQIRDRDGRTSYCGYCESAAQVIRDRAALAPDQPEAR